MIAGPVFHEAWRMWRFCFHLLVMEAAATSVWDIVRSAKLRDIIYIGVDQQAPGDVPHEHWGCSLNTGDTRMKPPLPSLVSVIIDCPLAMTSNIMNQTLLTLSLGRRGLLVRPVINWLLVSPWFDLDPMTDLMSVADTALLLEREGKLSTNITGYMTKLYKTSDGAVIQETVNQSIFIQHGKWADILPSHFSGFNGALVTVGCITQIPFAYLRKDSDGRTSWDGYALEFVKAMASKYNFRITTVGSRDSAYGNRQRNGSWSGLIGMVLDQEIDMVATGMTASTSRRQVVDFTFPYYITNYRLMLRVHDRDWFSIFKPLKEQVWLVYGLCAVLMLVVTNAMAVSPLNVWGFPSIKQLLHLEADVVQYFTGALFLQGGTFNPSPGRLRFVMGSFWVVILVISATYSSNLIASLSTHRIKLPFTSLEELADQDFYKPIVVNGTNVYSTIMGNAGDVYKRIARKIREEPELALDPGSDPVSRVESGPYVYMASRVLLQGYAVRRKDCSFFILPESFGSSHKALVLPKHSPFQPYFSKVVIQLMEGGINGPWWNKHFPVDKCTEALRVSAEAKPVTIDTLFGLFLILLSGIILACAVLLVENVIQYKQNIDL